MSKSIAQLPSQVQGSCISERFDLSFIYLLSLIYLLYLFFIQLCLSSLKEESMRNRALVPYRRQDDDDYVDGQVTVIHQGTSIPQQVQRQAVGPAIGAGMWAAILAVAFFFLLIGLIVHKYWEQISFAGYILILIVLGCIATLCIAGTYYLIALMRRHVKRPTTVVIKAQSGEEVVAVQQQGKDVEWRDYPPPFSDVKNLHLGGGSQRQLLAARPEEADPPTYRREDHWPVAEDFSALVSLLDRAIGQFPLGYALENGPGSRSIPVWVPAEKILSGMIGGETGNGKTTALYWLAILAIRQGWHTYMFDGKADLKKAFGRFIPCAYTPQEIERMAVEVTKLVDVRFDLASQDPEVQFKPVRVVLDEVDRLKERYDGISKLIETLVRKARSVNVDGYFTDQAFKVEEMGGQDTRGVVPLRVGFWADSEAARTIGIRKENGGAALMNLIAPPAPPGLAVVRSKVFDWRILRFPYISVEQVMMLLERYLQQPQGQLDDIPLLRPLPARATPGDSGNNKNASPQVGNREANGERTILTFPSLPNSAHTLQGAEVSQVKGEPESFHYLSEREVAYVRDCARQDDPKDRTMVMDDIRRWRRADRLGGLPNDAYKEVKRIYDEEMAARGRSEKPPVRAEAKEEEVG